MVKCGNDWDDETYHISTAGKSESKSRTAMKENKEALHDLTPNMSLAIRSKYGQLRTNSSYNSGIVVSHLG